MLPSNIELDRAMMEHLAKAAAELHAARSGRKNVLQSPDAREFLAGTADVLGLKNAATEVCRSEEIIAAWNQGMEPKEIAKLTGRSEQQVQAFVRNQQEKERLAADFEVPGERDKMGRGRKPATTAMNTVPNANCDARTLLQGGLLESIEDTGEDDEVSSPKRAKTS